MNPVEQVMEMAWGGLKSLLDVTEETIRRRVESVASLDFIEGVTREDIDRICRDLEMRLNVSMGVGDQISDTTVQAWYPQAKSGGQIDTRYWDRYRQYLSSDKGFSDGPGSIIRGIYEANEGVLEKCGNPLKDGNFDVRGMVVGNVQSGKTANYTGLINLAAGAGYKVFIVIAGIHNTLRSQTQRRLDEGFVGVSSLDGATAPIGVGKYGRDPRPWSFTDVFHDFKRNNPRGRLKSLTVPSIFVIKKNMHTLRNLTTWLQTHNREYASGLIEDPMMLIDDEADNASINIAYGRDMVSRINGQIRELMNCFSRSTYVGYTATPFANIFISPREEDADVGDDLFPRNFIRGLDAPATYHGPNRIHIDPGPVDPLVKIDDNENLLPMRHQIDHDLIELPESLREAVRAFVLGCAIRGARGDDRKHMSMLVNASRFTGIQQRLKVLVETYLEEICRAIEVHALRDESAWSTIAELRDLKTTFDAVYADGSAEDFGRIIEHLPLQDEIEAMAINSRSPDRLNYDERPDGLKVIAIGGFSLSRGLTLEGLMTTYFLRNSRMYDTLLQMGRWFGYRHGYEDLVRIWMPEQMQDAYTEISQASQELRDELRVMAALGGTPEDFGLKVRSSPNSLMITARNKEGDGEFVTVSPALQRTFVETAALLRHPDRLEDNREQARLLAQRIVDAGIPSVSENSDIETTSGYLFSGVPAKIVRDFVTGFANDDDRSNKTQTSAIAPYIMERSTALGGSVDDLGMWDVLFVSLSESRGDGNLVVDDYPIGPIITQKRTLGMRSDADRFLITNKQRVASRGVERAGLRKDEIVSIEADYRERTGKTGSIPDHVYRFERDRPLLIVHLLDVRDHGEPEVRAVDEAVVAWSMSLGTSSLSGTRGEYRVNRTWLRSMVSADDGFAAEIREDIEREDERSTA